MVSTNHLLPGLLVLLESGRSSTVSKGKSVRCDWEASNSWGKSLEINPDGATDAMDVNRPTNGDMDIWGATL